MTDRTTEMLALADERKMYTHMGHTHEVSMPQRSDTEIAHMVRMLMRSDLNHESVVCAARDRMLYLIDRVEKLETALRASVGAYVEGQRSMRERASQYAQERSISADSDISRRTYRRIASAIASLPLEAQESDGGNSDVSMTCEHRPEYDCRSSSNPCKCIDGMSMKKKTGATTKADGGHAVREALEELTDPIYLTEVLTKIGICDDCQERGCQAALKPEAAPAGEVVVTQARASGYLSLANLIEEKRNAVLDQYGQPGFDQAKRDLLEILWNDKGTFAPALRLAATPPAITEREKVAREALADDLERLCCAETEGKFFDLITDRIQTIIGALRDSGVSR